MKRIAFMFPGQGSQKVGMGKDFYDASDDVKQLYNMANDVLEFDLSSLMFDGPQETLTETEHTQPALLLSSMAAYTMIKQENIEPVMMVGHSLGEYSALTAAGTLQLAEALPLVRTRGRLMEAALPKGQGTMAAVLGLDETQIKDGIQQLSADAVVDLANLNCPGQIVISGSRQGIEDISPILTELGARRVIPLNVSGPFHSRFMKEASEQFATHLDAVTWADASAPVYANVSAAPVQNQTEIKQLLIEQLYSSVRFQQSVEEMIAAGVEAFVELGTGNVLCGLVRKINRQVKTFSVQDPKSLEKFLTWYKEDV